jgi:hypothetical protein
MRRFESCCPRETGDLLVFQVLFLVIIIITMLVFSIFTFLNMAQKTFPRSLRSSKLLSQDFSFYSEKTYPSVWAKALELTHVLFAFSQKNLLLKSKTKKTPSQRSGRKKVWPSFLGARPYTTTNGLGVLRCSPILFKFSQQSLSRKYNPLKTVPLARSSSKKVWKKPLARRQPRGKNLSFIFFNRAQ